jgi:hypothetical protein
MTAPGGSRADLLRDLSELLENDRLIITGLELAAVLDAWEFTRTVPVGTWTQGPSYWIHPRHPSLQLPIQCPGVVHPEIARAVVSVVHSVMVHEPIATAPTQ